MTSDSQCDAILRHLQRKSITPLDALKLYGSFRLGARIWDLKRRGHDIVTTWHKTSDGKRVARYVLLKKARAA